MQDQVLDVDAHPVRLLQLVRQSLKWSVAELDDRLAAAAYEVVVLTSDVGPASDLVTEVHAHRQAVVLKGFQRAVDRCRVDGGIPFQDVGTDLLDGSVLVSLTQDLQDAHARSRRLQSTLVQDCLEGIDLFSIRHLAAW